VAAVIANRRAAANEAYLTNLFLLMLLRVFGECVRVAEARRVGNLKRA
jgi:hypothetical protein